MWVREASARNAMPTIDKLDDPDFFPYRYGHAFWAYVAGGGAIARSAICCAPPALMETSKPPSPACSAPTKTR